MLVVNVHVMNVYHRIDVLHAAVTHFNFISVDFFFLNFNLAFTTFSIKITTEFMTDYSWQTYSISMIVILFLEGMHFAVIKKNYLNLICFRNI